MNTPKLAVLAQELETIRDGKGMNIGDIIKKCRNDDYPRQALIRDLREAKLSFFAEKVAHGYYELRTEKENNAQTNN